MNKAFENILHIYCRVSTEIQVETGHSLLAQENAGIVRAKSLGLGYKLHIEKGQSATSDDIEFKSRPVLKALLDLCDEGKVSDIFVTEQDRISRSPLATYFIKRVLIVNNINLHTGNQIINLHDPEQSFVADLSSLLAKRERDLFVKRSQRGVIEGAKKGRWPGVILPYGYRRNSNRIIEIDPEESQIYLRMVELSLAGNGTNTIARILTDEGIETRCKKVLPNGTKVKNRFTTEIRVVHNDEFVWRAGTVYCILTNTIYKGVRKFKNEIISAPTIIGEEKWDQVQVNLKQNKNNSGNNSKHFYLFRGNIRCAKCNANYFGKIKHDERVYMCSSKRTKSCGSRSLNLDRFNGKIWNLIINNKIQQKTIKDELKSINATEKLKELKKMKSGLENQVLSIEGRRNKLIILFEMDKINLEQFENRNNAIVKEKKLALSYLQKANSDLEDFSKRVATMEESLADSKIIRTINSWSDKEKKVFVDRKVKNIKVHWHAQTWQHIIEIEIELGGLVINEVILMDASNKPARIQRKLNSAEAQQLIKAGQL